MLMVDQQEAINLLRAQEIITGKKERKILLTYHYFKDDKSHVTKTGLTCLIARKQ